LPGDPAGLPVVVVVLASLPRPRPLLDADSVGAVLLGETGALGVVFGGEFCGRLGLRTRLAGTGADDRRECSIGRALG